MNDEHIKVCAGFIAINFNLESISSVEEAVYKLNQCYTRATSGPIYILMIVDVYFVILYFQLLWQRPGCLVICTEINIIL